MFSQLRSLPAVRSSLAIALIASLAMCAVPLLAVHGPESALLLGVLLPPLASGVSAHITAYLRRATPQPSLGYVFEACLGYGACLFLVPTLVLLLDSLRVRNCTPLEGLSFMLLGPGFGVVLGCLTGLVLALLVPRSRLAVLLAIALPVLTMLLAIGRFYATPGIFFYGHYYGFFPGTIYDENVTITGPFYWLRVFSCALIAAIVLLTVSFVQPNTLRIMRKPRSVLTLVSGLACLALVLTAEVFAVSLGHASSEARLREVLGGELKSARCKLAFPRELGAADRERLGQDCDFRVTQAERWLGVTHPEPLQVFLFRSPQEKYALMGAEGTNLAKPWRSEVFISDQGWPNPVLGHELVHVVARATGRGPLRVAGRLGGFWPDPSLIEGLAVAAAWQPSGGLTPHEWSRALLELGLLPRLSELFGAGFLGQQKRLAYTVSGSLLRFVAERWGVSAVRRAYAEADVAGAVGVHLSQLETEWQRFLRAQPISRSALALAQARFMGPSVFSAVCPHALAQLRDELRVQVALGDDMKAQTTCREILSADENDLGSRTALVASLARSGNEPEALRELSWLEARAPKPFTAAARQALADEAFRRGRIDEAKAAYMQLLHEPIDEDQRRTLQVKWLACDSSEPRERQLLFELLIGEPGRRADGATAVYLARELRAIRGGGLASYLEARQLFFVSRFEYAAQLLHDARAQKLPTVEIANEALRLEAMARFAIGQRAESERLWREFREAGSPAQATEADDWLQRIRLGDAAVVARPSPATTDPARRPRAE